ncbi:MAG: DUF502 domain-containing protein [Candidatus Dadabacteria bacterium]|nr:DUF502 domain-containing protein [Candidatus Dadabacteria bacterium]MCY4263205.1 DUF502 domain-containing protein [Candidatus Dadabacteria bacterium]
MTRKERIKIPDSNPSQSSFFKQSFIAGILIIVPFGVTIFVLYKLIKWMLFFFSTGPAGILRHFIDLPPYVFQGISFVIGLAATLLLIILLGAVTRNFIGRRMLLFSESIISKIPLARTFYVSVKQVVQTLFITSQMQNMKRVVLIEYPRKGIRAIAFVTGVTESGRNHNTTDRRLVSLFIPTTPNPTSGIYVMAPEEELEELDISVEDAFRLIVSAGISQSNSNVSGQDKKND